jgi:hypothetical protein
VRGGCSPQNNLGKLKLKNLHGVRRLYGCQAQFVKPEFHIGFRLIAHNAVIGVYDGAGNVIETQEHKGDFKEW